MTAKKTNSVTGDVHPDDANGSGSTVTSKPAEAEKDVVSEAKPAKRVTAAEIAKDIAGDYVKAKAEGNRVTITIEGPNGLVQTFYATIEEGIREF